MLITFSGLDGAGKSTMAECLKAILEQQNRPAVVRHMYYQMGTYAFLRSLQKWIVRGARSAKKSPRENAAHVDNHEQEQPGSFKVVGLRLMRAIIWNKPFRRYVYLLDLFIFLFYRLYIEKLKGQVLIMDRYFYDRLVDLADGRGLRFNSFLARFTPTPALPIYLEVSPQQAYVRKREQSVEYLTRRWVSYHMIFPRLPTSVVLAGNNDMNANRGALAKVVGERINANESRKRKLVRGFDSALASGRHFLSALVSGSGMG